MLGTYDSKDDFPLRKTGEQQQLLPLLDIRGSICVIIHLSEWIGVIHL